MSRAVLALLVLAAPGAAQEPRTPAGRALLFWVLADRPPQAGRGRAASRDRLADFSRFPI